MPVPPGEDGAELAAVDTLQHGLAGDVEDAVAYCTATQP
jgi:hypothetical protein